MANTVQQSGRAGGGRRWRAPTRRDLVTFLVAAMLCSASYYLGIWHNSRGAADSSVLGPSAACGGGDVVARAADADDEPLDFEAYHAAENAGLSASASATAAARTTGARRALRARREQGRGAEAAAAGKR